MTIILCLVIACSVRDTLYRFNNSSSILKHLQWVYATTTFFCNTLTLNTPLA